MRIGQRISANNCDPTENGGSQKTKLPSKVPLAEKVAGHACGPYVEGEPRRGHVHALEPQATLHALVRRRRRLFLRKRRPFAEVSVRQVHAQLALHGDACLAASVTALRAAAGAADAPAVEVPLLGSHVPQNFAQLSLVDGAFYGRPDVPRYRNHTVPVRSLDSVLRDAARTLGGTDAGAPPWRCPALVKVDVEGMEHAALTGLRATLARCWAAPPALYIENNVHPDFALARDHCPDDTYVAFSHVFTSSRRRR